MPFTKLRCRLLTKFLQLLESPMNVSLQFLAIIRVYANILGGIPVYILWYQCGGRVTREYLSSFMYVT